jgi:hypothetical protein
MECILQTSAGKVAWLLPRVYRQDKENNVTDECYSALKGFLHRLLFRASVVNIILNAYILIIIDPIIFSQMQEKCSFTLNKTKGHNSGPDKFDSPTELQFSRVTSCRKPVLDPRMSASQDKVFFETKFSAWKCF